MKFSTRPKLFWQSWPNLFWFESRIVFISAMITIFQNLFSKKLSFVRVWNTRYLLTYNCFWNLVRLQKFFFRARCIKMRIIQLSYYKLRRLLSPDFWHWSISRIVGPWTKCDFTSSVNHLITTRDRSILRYCKLWIVNTIKLQSITFKLPIHICVMGD